MNTLLSLKEVAEILGVSSQTLRRWDSSGKLKAVRNSANNYRQYRRSDIQALLGKEEDSLALRPLEPLRPTELPQIPTSFVGRQEQMATLDRCFGDGVRLVTLTGAGGIGKTRLALEYGHLALGNPIFSSRVLFCDLSEARTTADICSVLCATLGLPLVAAGSVLGLAETFADWQLTLLILDNFEQLSSVALDTVSVWLQKAPEVRFLVTSRTLLAVPGEKVVEVGPLSLPHSTDGKDLLESDAIRLFSERAAAFDCVVAKDELRVVANLVARLDGIPLAIELAAYRMRTFSPNMMLNEMSDRLDVVGRNPTPSTERHATLVKTIEWSWDLLSPGEQEGLRQCGVFRGGFSLEAAREILKPTLAGSEPTVVDLVSRLRDSSLLRVTVPPWFPEERRFALLQTVRDWVHQQKEIPLNDPMRRRHAEYYEDFSKQWADAAQKGDREARRRLMTERDNINVAVRFFISQDANDGGFQRALDMLLALEEPLTSAGFLESQIALLTRIIEQRPSHGIAAHALAARGRAYHLVLEGDKAQADLLSALEMAGDEERTLRARIHCTLGMLAAVNGRVDDAQGSCKTAVALLGSSDDHVAKTYATACLAAVTSWVDQDKSRELFREVVRLAELSGDQHRRAVALACLGDIELGKGNPETALALHEEALSDLVAWDDRRAAAISRAHIGMALQELGDLTRAEDIFRAAVDDLSMLHIKRCGGLVHAHLGVIAATHNRAEEAIAELQAAKALLVESGDPSLIATFKLYRGHLDLMQHRVALEHGDAASALRHLAQAKERIERATESLPSGVSAQIDEFSTAKRLLETAVELTENPQDAPNQLVLEAQGHYFQLPEGGRIELTRRKTLRRVLAELVSAHHAAPGTPVPVLTIVEAGWPGEKHVGMSGHHRVRVAIWTLRRLGLGAHIETCENGYRLAPNQEIRIRES